MRKKIKTSRGIGLNPDCGIKTALIVDPYLEDLSGHHYNNLMEIANGLKTQKFNILIAVVKNFQPPLSESGYSFFPVFWGTGRKILRRKNVFSKLASILRFLFKTLKNFLILRKLISKTNPYLIFQTTTYMKDLLPWILLKRNRIPTFFLFHALLKSTSERVSFKLFLHTGFLNSHIFCSYSEYLIEFFRRNGVKEKNLLKLPLIAPIFMWDKFLSSKEPENISKNKGLPQKKVYTYPGSADRRKGFLFLAQVIPNLMDKYSFQIQCHQIAQDPEISEAINSLKKLKSENLLLIPRILSEEEFFDLLYQSHCILLPYNPDYYGQAGGSISGILPQAFLLGKPVIVTENTWLANKVRETGAGVIFQYGDIEGFEGAIEKIAQNYKEYASRAQEAGDQIRKIHGGKAIAQTITSFIKKNFPEFTN